MVTQKCGGNTYYKTTNDKQGAITPADHLKNQPHAFFTFQSACKGLKKLRFQPEAGCLGRSLIPFRLKSGAV